MAGTVVQVDLHRDLCSVHFDEQLPFLLQGRVDPDRYAATMCAATSKIRSATTRAWLAVFIFLLMVIPTCVFFPISVVNWGFDFFYIQIGIFVTSFIVFFAILLSVRRVRHHLDCHLHEENVNYYNALGINFKYHYQYRHSFIAIEIAPPLHRNNQNYQYHYPPQQQQVPAPKGGDIYSEQQQQQHYPVQETAPLVYQQQQPYTAPTFTFEQPRMQEQNPPYVRN